MSFYVARRLPIASNTVEKMILQQYFTATLLVAIPLAVQGQKELIIPFTNPSFEDIPKQGQPPSGWTSVNMGDESPPDVQPGWFEVMLPANHGSTYLGLVTRDNETWEAVSQRLARPLEAGQCYEFTADLCRSEVHMSVSKSSNQMTNFKTPIKLRVWGGNGFSDKAEMLYETPLVVNTRWLQHSIRLTPKKNNYTFLVLEAYYKTPTLFPYNGNLLVDNLSPIKQIPCTPDPMIAAKRPTPRPSGTLTARGNTDTQRTRVPSVTPLRAEPPVAEATKSEPKIERRNLKQGTTIRLDKVYFDTNKHDIKQECEASLQELASFLTRNTDVVVEVGGHTNNRPAEGFANKLSTERAKAVADWLVDQGVPTERVQFKGYGKTMPIVPNDTEENLKKNQRVEIKILKIN